MWTLPTGVGTVTSVLGRSMAEAVLTRLGFADWPASDMSGLAALYAAWCRRVPFDNLEKRIHLVAGRTDPFPNRRPEAFFASYLAHNTGGTCWPSSNALHALLTACGFDARRASCWMGDDGKSEPVHNHGTIIARVEGQEFWVDSSMLTVRVVPLHPGRVTDFADPVNPVRAKPFADRWRVVWQIPIVEGERVCRLLDDDVDEAHYLTRYEASRHAGPFNAGIYATRMVGGSKITVARGQRFERTTAGMSVSPVADMEERDRTLVEELGYSDAIVAALPPDDQPARTD